MALPRGFGDLTFNIAATQMDAASQASGAGANLVVRRLRSPLGGPFDLELRAGGCVAITGASGSGKTVFLRMIADLDPNEGKVWLQGRERSSMPAPEWRKRVIYVAAQSAWWADSVIEHFPTDQRSQLASLVGRLRLAKNVLNAPVLELSTGEKQRLAIARALLLNPRVLLLDEPTGALDQGSVALVEALLGERTAAGASILLVTHDPKQAERLGDRHYYMAAGQLEAACIRSY
jgi:putative ABC transport system ATP-binding protein